MEDGRHRGEKERGRARGEFCICWMEGHMFVFVTVHVISRFFECFRNLLNAHLETNIGVFEGERIQFIAVEGPKTVTFDPPSGFDNEDGRRIGHIGSPHTESRIFHGVHSDDKRLAAPRANRAGLQSCDT